MKACETQITTIVVLWLIINGPLVTVHNYSLHQLSRYIKHNLVTHTECCAEKAARDENQKCYEAIQLKV